MKIAAVLQKYIDQSISVNTSYNPEHYPEQQLPMSELLKHMLMGYKWGHKTWYYMNLNDGQGEVQVDKLIATENNVEENNLSSDTDCDSCIL